LTSYNILNSTTNRIAANLLHRIQTISKSHANQDGDFIIAVCMSPSDSLIFALLSIWKAGAAYLPLDPSFPVNRIEHILNESKPVLVIHDDNVNSVIFGSTDAIKFSTLKSECSVHSNANIPIEKTLTKGKNDLAIVLYTSGSTGIPKGVRLPHAIIQNRLEWQYQRFPYSATEKCAVFKTALTFVDSVSEIFGPLLNGLKLIVVPKDITVDPERLVDLLQKYRIERLVLVPTLLRSLLMYLPLQNQADLLHNLKIWICSGEPLVVQLAKQFFSYFIEGKFKETCFPFLKIIKWQNISKSFNESLVF
jgi:non-ribosomal peptide synthetase component F